MGDDVEAVRLFDVTAAEGASGERFSAEPRRTYLGQTALVGEPDAHAPSLAALSEEADALAAGDGSPCVEMPVALCVNGRDVALTVDTRTSLLDLLRERLGLTGSKKGCDHGQCGACTVLLDGRRVNACLTLAVSVDGSDVTTIEGLARGDELHPLQRAFVTHDGFQCGYCTSGQIMSAVAVLDEPWGPADDDVREAMSGNICRCGAYPGIVAAVQDVRRNGGGMSR
jgi:xanthine dehydrogenase YagT iron-sulfur-binding subunit